MAAQKVDERHRGKSKVSSREDSDDEGCNCSVEDESPEFNKHNILEEDKF